MRQAVGLRGKHFQERPVLTGNSTIPLSSRP